MPITIAKNLHEPQFLFDLKGLPLTSRSRVIIPFRYPGGKFYALSALKKFWLAINHDEYREPFVGGGSVFFAKHKTRFNWLNDIDSELVNTYRIMADPLQREKLIELISAEVASKDRWLEMRNFQPKNELERAYRYYYLNRTSFSGKMISPGWGYRPKRSLPPHRWHEKVNPCGEKLQDVKITSGDFEQLITLPAQGDKCLLFVDPPYFKPKKKKHYVNGFDHKDHLRLSIALRKTDHSFILTYEDVQEVRDLYKWARIYPVEFFYRVDNSSENGVNVKTGTRRKGTELIIANFRVY